MGIWAPLHILPEQNDQLVFTSGWGTLNIGAGWVTMGTIILVMRFAILPLLHAAGSGDWLLLKGIPYVLLFLGIVFVILGIGTLGYRKRVRLDRKSKHMTVSTKILGYPIYRKRFPFQQIHNWSIENITPKRYNPDVNKQDRPVGFWRLSVCNQNGKQWIVDQAPQEKEIRHIQQTIQEFMTP